MNSVVVFVGLLGVAFGSYYGLPHPVQDTPEVALAKAEHLAAVEAVKRGIHYIPKPVHYTPHNYYDVPQKKWTGPIALPPGYDKHGAPLPVLDTPEVAAEKSHHFYLYSKAAYAAAAEAGHQYAPSHSAWAPAKQYYYGSVPADTPEVEAAKAAHFAAHAARHY